MLVINSGSSSVKFSLYAADALDLRSMNEDLRSIYEGELDGIGASAKLTFSDAEGNDLGSEVGEVKAATMDEAIGVVERAVALERFPAPDAVGHRVVHPGPHLRGHQRLTPDVLQQLREAVAFAPLHDPAAIEIIDEMMRRLPGIPHFACFDTVFHETMGYEAKVYPLPEEVRAEGVRRYGFHGLSCESVVAQMREVKNFPFRQHMVIAHLGSGCSVTACIDGKSVDTTMGLTPTGGVVMGTRPGDLDPGVVLYLLRRPGATLDSVEAMVNRDSGLKGLFGSGDMRKLHEAWNGSSADMGNPGGDTKRDDAEVAFEVFTSSVRRAIGGMAAVHGVDAIIFTGGIGEHDPVTRDAIARGLLAGQPLIDPWLNHARGSGMRKISMDESKIAVYVIPAEEDLMIARHVVEMYRTAQHGEPRST